MSQSPVHAPDAVSAQLRAAAAVVLRDSHSPEAAKVLLDGLLEGAGLPPGRIAELIDPLGRPSYGGAVAAPAKPRPAPPAGIAAPGELQPVKQYAPIGEVENGGLTKRDMLAFVSAAVDQNGLVGHNIDGYNDLIQHGLNRIMTQLFDIDRMLRNERAQTEQDRRRKSFQIRFQFHDVKTGRPVCTTYLTGQFMDLMPGQARITGLPYSGPVTLGATATVRALYEDGRVEEKTAEIPPFQIGGFPVMTGSVVCHTHNMTRESLKELGEDPADPGGYFIAKRGEYVVDLLENIRYNSVHIHRRMKPNEHVRAEFLSQPGGAFENSSQIRVRFMTNGQLTVEINSTKFEKVRLPFYLIYRLFGMTDDRAVAETVVFDVDGGGPITAHMLDVLEAAFQLADAAFAPLVAELNRERLVQMTAERVAKYLINPTAYLSNEHAVQFLNEDLLGSPSKPGGLDKVLLPHMGQAAEARIRKLRFLGLIIHKMLLVHLGVLPPTDRDSYQNKRVHGAGVSLAKAFKTQVNNSVVIPIYRAFRRELKNNPWESITDKTLIDTFRNALATSDLNRAMEQAITAGNKTIVVRRRAATNRVSSQALERKNGLNTFSALRTVVTQNAGNASKQTERADMMRRVHPTYVGYICVAQSADTGENVGMRKQLALTAGVCTAGDALPLELRLLEDPAVTELDAVDSADAQRRGLARLFVNGKWIGYCASAHELVGRYRALRREGRVVDPRTTVAWDPILDEAEFWLDVGRLTRPLLIVDSNLEAYDAALRARHAWARAAGAGARAEEPAGVAVGGADGAPAGLYFAGADEYVAFTPRWRALGHDALGYAHNAPAALVAEGLAAAAEPPAEARDVVAGARAARRAAAERLGGGPPPAVEFVQNTRFTPAHVRGIVEGRLSLDDLVAEGVAEYVAPEEQANCYVAESIEVLRAARHDATRRFSHVDVEQAIFGLAAHKPPFGNHTQPARVTYETNQGRQTGGWYVLNFPFRTDKNRFFQFYNEVPLVRTVADKWVPPNGMNTYIAYASYGGDNQEDSAIVCQASADRGLFAGAFFRFEMAELEKGEMFCNPDALTTKNLKPNASYEKLADGLVRPGSVVRYGDVLIGRVAKLTRGRAGADERYLFTDRSLVYRLREPAVVEAVLRPRGANDELFALVKLRFERPLRVGDKLCLTPDHDVLTWAGWKPIREVTTADRVATLVGDDLVYAAPTATHEFEVDEDLYEIETQLISQQVTLNHRMYVKPRDARGFGLHEAAVIAGKRVSYKRDAANRNPARPTFVCWGGEGGDPDLEIPMDTWLAVLGAFIADGWVDKRNDHYTLISMIKPRKIEFLNAALAGTNIRRWHTCGRYHIDSPQIYRELAPSSVGAINKRLPEYVWRLSQAESRMLLDALIQGDGHRGETFLSYYTSSVGLAGDVQRLALHAGWAASVWLHTPAGAQATFSDGRVAIATVDSWRVGITQSKLRPTVNHGHVKTQNAQTERFVPYAGAVHCLTVPSGVFYVRRNGRASWTGNSSRSGNKCLTPDHDVLTATGWKPISEVSLDDLVLARPPGEVSLGFRAPTALHTYEVDESLVHVTGPGVDQLATAEHRLPVPSADAERGFELTPLWRRPDEVRTYLGAWPPAGDGGANAVARLLASWGRDFAGSDRGGWRETRAGWDSANLRGGEACRALFVAAPEWARAWAAAMRHRTPVPHMALPWLQAFAALAGARLESAPVCGPWDRARMVPLPQEVAITCAGTEYRGPVHCLSVPGELFCVRRAGRVSWTGNSIAALMLSQSDMPFTESGLTPDIIVNMTSFPTRMTIGQLIETSLGKVCAKKGVIADGTAFLPVDHLAMMRELRENGFRYNGRERMYNGMTGEWFDAAIFIGPTAEQRLQKFVLDDEQSVAGSGPTDATTGQPIGGRLVQGGLRLGEMEHWGLESHGSMLNLYEKTSTDSDGRTMNVCRGCGSLAVHNEYHGVYSCRTCGEMADIALVDSSKSAILLHEELAAANIRVRLGLSPREFEERPPAALTRAGPDAPERPAPAAPSAAKVPSAPLPLREFTLADFDRRGARARTEGQ